jgi:hypothetical protein
MVGTEPAHDEFGCHLGTGGMGELHQAIDSKLGGSVAIKLLPEAFRVPVVNVADVLVPDAPRLKRPHLL